LIEQKINPDVRYAAMTEWHDPFVNTFYIPKKIADAKRVEKTATALTPRWTGCKVTSAPDVLVLDSEPDVVVDDSLVPVVFDEEVSDAVG
jgi:hypothetical protein